MSQLSANEIVHRALHVDELDLLLLGSTQYRYLPKWSPAATTDLAGLLAALYGLATTTSRHNLRDRLSDAITRIIGAYEGIIPVATIVFFEAWAHSLVTLDGHAKADTSLGLPLDRIAGALMATIAKYKARLAVDKTGEGALWNDGLLGALCLLNKKTRSLGGPPFCEEEGSSKR